MIYNIRMAYRSQLVQKSYAHKRLNAVLQAWRVRHVFWRRMRRKFQVLRYKYQRDMEHMTLHEWSLVAKRSSDRVKKVELTRRLHSAR